jgi:electron transfer flavoprotein-quinone oxidoreductase
MASGEAAARAVLEASRVNDFSAASLSCYQKMLENSFVMKDLKRYRKMNRFAEKNPEFFGPYINVITRAAVEYFAVKEMPKRSQEWQMLKNFRKNLHRSTGSRFPLLRFFWKTIKGVFSFI